MGSSNRREMPPRHLVTAAPAGRPGTAPTIDVPASHLDPMINGGTRMLLRPASSSSSGRLLVAHNAAASIATRRPLSSTPCRPAHEANYSTASSSSASSPALPRPASSCGLVRPRAPVTHPASVTGAIAASAPSLPMPPPQQPGHGVHVSAGSSQRLVASSSVGAVGGRRAAGVVHVEEWGEWADLGVSEGGAPTSDGAGALVQLDGTAGGAADNGNDDDDCHFERADDTPQPPLPPQPQPHAPAATRSAADDADAIAADWESYCELLFGGLHPIILGDPTSTPGGAVSFKRTKRQDDHGRSALQPEIMTIEPTVPVAYLPRRFWPTKYHVLTERAMVALDDQVRSPPYLPWPHGVRSPQPTHTYMLLDASW